MFSPIASWGAWHSWCAAGQLAASASSLNSWNESSQICNLVCNILNNFSTKPSSSIEGTNYNHEYHSYHLRTSPCVTLRLVTQPGDTSSFSSTVAGSMSMSENHRNFLVTELPPRTTRFQVLHFLILQSKTSSTRIFTWTRVERTAVFQPAPAWQSRKRECTGKGKEYPHSYFESWHTIGSSKSNFFFFFFTNGYPFTNGTWD